jgi:hypothetical protein
MLCRKLVWRRIERIWIGEADVPPRGDSVARVFSHDVDVLIHLLFTGAILGFTHNGFRALDRALAIGWSNELIGVLAAVA